MGYFCSTLCGVLRNPLEPPTRAPPRSGPTAATRCEGVRQRQLIVKRGLVVNRGSLALGPQERSEGGRACHMRYRHRTICRRHMSPTSHNMSNVRSQLVFESDPPTPSQLEVHGARPRLVPQILGVWRVLDSIFGVVARVHVRKRAVRKSLCRWVGARSVLEGCQVEVLPEKTKAANHGMVIPVEMSMRPLGLVDLWGPSTKQGPAVFPPFTIRQILWAGGERTKSSTHWRNA